MNIEALLHPISDTSPTGVDLSFSSEFDALQELRRADDPTLPQGEFVTELKTADWQAAAALGEQVLATRSKDLRVAGWLVEAWSHGQGFAGMANGLLLVDAFCTRFWADLHPRIEDGDAELRIGSLAWLLSRTETLSSQVALLKSGSRGVGRAEIDAARARPGAQARAADGAMPPLPEGVPTTDDLTRWQRETPRAYLVANLADALRALNALNSLQATVDSLLGIDGPGFATARNALDVAVHAARRLAREAGATEVDQASTETPDPSAMTAADAATDAPTSRAGLLRSRPQAIQQLRHVAEFFRRTEPHSPVAYLADKAAQWGEMPLHDWLQAVVKDSAALAQLDDLLGIKRTGSASAG